jgi:dipeptidyl aminopeptidase/acylaminoacyl peptidase
MHKIINQNNQETASYGSWRSPITAELIVKGSIGLGQIEVEGDHLYWTEGRPAEGGRSAIVHRHPSGVIKDLIPAPFNARSRVHEYGGGSLAVDQGMVYFVNFADQRIYTVEIPVSANSEISPEIKAPKALTEAGKYRYADLAIDRPRQRLIAIREDHSFDGEPINTLVAIDLTKVTNQKILASGQDFYSSPALSPDGQYLAWLTWQHPDMPWYNTQLWVAVFDEVGNLGQPQLVAGGKDESIFQPEWGAEGSLYFVSDRSNWWNLYCWPQGEITPICEMAAEFGLPQWVFAMKTYGFTSSEEIICTYGQQGIWYLGKINLQTKKLTTLKIPYTDISGLRVTNGKAVFLGGSATAPTALVVMDIKTQELEVVKVSSQVTVSSDYFSVPEAIAFPTEQGSTAYGFYYPPCNPDYIAIEGEKPPLIVKSHGGPTAATSSSFSLRIQFWTSRGFAVLDVNYGGSTGYGREYRLRLDGQWGIVDVDDCTNGAKYLVSRGLADPQKLAIAGGSAGGFTTLAALTFRDTFQAGASYYGVSDLEALARDTHKFEARYLDRLIGAYPDQQEIYKERSPINFTDKLDCPVIFFQGLEDKVVPPNQAEMMVAALQLKGLPVAYVAYPGEQHGFRQAENIQRTLEGELYFYSRVFGFALAEAIAPVEIFNLNTDQ